MQCPLCHAEIEAPPERAGQMVRCEACSGYVRIPKIAMCPGCGATVEETTEICPVCGYDLIQMEPVRNGDEPRAPIGQRILVYLNDNLPGIFRPVPLAGFVLCLILLVTATAAGVFFLALGAAVFAVALLIAGMFFYLHGLAFICTGELCGLRGAMENMRGECWTVFLFLAFLPLLLVLAGFGLCRFFI